MISASDVLNEDVAKRVEQILRTNSIHRAAISFRAIATDTYPSAESHRMITFDDRSDGDNPVYILSDKEEVFHIASITKLLVAVALIHAVESKADVDPRWARFKDIGREPVTQVINRHTADSGLKLGDLPGAPSIYDLIIHSKSLDSINDLMFAPDTTPMWTLQHFRQDRLPLLSGDTRREQDGSRWTKYSNTNYAVIALAIETLWGASLANFMLETLFNPLSMRLTSIGYPDSLQRPSSRWTVDENGVRRQVLISEYEADGAEVGALGAYSTVQDLDKFFSCIIKAESGEEYEEFTKTADVLFEMKNKHDKDVWYTPLGLHAKLHSSTIGYLSSNRLQFPNQPFTEYPVISSRSSRVHPVYYMTGSAVGSCCATAIHRDDPADSKNHFVLVVLTDTSGPIDTSDHILRLLLREYVAMRAPRLHKTLKGMMPKTVEHWVAESRKEALSKWVAAKQCFDELEKKSTRMPFRLDGTFVGVGFQQRLTIETHGSHYRLKVAGPRISRLTGMPNESVSFRLIWRNRDSLELYVPMYLSIDRLGDGDWSQLTFKVKRDGDQVNELIRDCRSGARHYRRG